MTLSPRVGWKSQKAIRCVRKKSEACLRHGTKRSSEVAAGEWIRTTVSCCSRTRSAD
jgi:hypothetical protein